MQTLWYILVSILFIGFAVLDGFDIGVGTIYLLITRNEAERQQARSAIGPIWGGNEVWLIAGAGTLFFAFPDAYAAVFSKFYLGLFMILWALILRGLSLELRSQLDNPLWHSFWDFLFNLASFGLAGLWGIVLGNFIRGIAIQTVGDPTIPFWTSFKPDQMPGLIDWYTLVVGGFGLLLLVIHGANYLAWKTTGDLHQRVKKLSSRGVWAIIPTLALVVGLTMWVRPALMDRFIAHPLGFVFPLLVMAALVVLIVALRQENSGKAFLASSLLILFLLVTVAFALFPNFMVDVAGKDNVTAFNSMAQVKNLQLGLAWFGIGFLLLIGYVVYMYKSFWGKIPESAQGETY